MGKRGPAPTPTQVLRMRGSWRAKARTGEPRVHSGLPEPPFALSAAGARAWEHLAPRLDAAGILSQVDGQVFARYCEHWALWQELEAFVRKSGHAHPVKNKHGDVIGVEAYPQVRLLVQVSEHLLRLEQHLGLTPSARAGLAAGGGGGDVGGESPFRARAG